MFDPDWFYPVAVILTGYVVMGITGFGSALVLVPLLARQWPLVETVSLVIALDIPASMLHGGLNVRQVQWRELSRLVMPMALGTLLGLWMLGQLEQRWLLLVLGAYVVTVGLRVLLPAAAFRPAHPRWVWLAGLLVGWVEVMFATAGPIVVAWLQRRLDGVAALRASVPVVMVVAGAIALAVLASSVPFDLATQRMRWLVAMPVALLGVVLGNRLARHIPMPWMKRLMAVLLTVSGVSLMRHFWQ